jgi:hypothetical protein
MKTARWRNGLPLCAVTLLLIYAAPAAAQGPNLALNKPLFSQGRNRRSGKVGGLGYYTGIALGT